MTERRLSSPWFRRARVAGIGGLVLLLGLGLLLLSTAPTVDHQKKPSAGDIASARAVIKQAKASQAQDAPVRLRLEARQIEALALLAGETSGIRRMDAQVSDGAVDARASLPLGAGLWINAAARVTGEHDGFPAIRVRIGRLALPAALSRWSADSLRWLLLQRGVDLPPLDDVIRHFAVSDGAVIADLALPRNTGLIEGAVGTAGQRVDDRLVARIYCRLARSAAAEREPALASLVQLAFRDAAGAEVVGHNRAAFVALALHVVGEQARPLAPAAVELSGDCPPPAARVLLQGRPDLAKHWTLSAALSAVLGERTAVTLGEWKELNDSLPAGSGFSFVDLAANRSGLHLARHALDAKSAGATARSLQAATDASLLPPALTRAPEGLSDVEFADRFGTRDEQRYRDAVLHIDRQLAHSAS